nr:PTS mannose transporter subunit IID [Megamonas funiformis]
TDVGSSIISAGLAIEGLSMQLHQRVKIADAPIVEGAIAAASEAAKGSNLMTVLNVTETAKSVSKRG